MVKKLFALASVSALAGLVSAVGAAGCSETVVQPGAEQDAGIQDSGKRETGPRPDDDDDDNEPTSCASENPVDHTKSAYTTALHEPGACTDDDVQTLVAYFKANSSKSSFTTTAWAGSVDDDCASCVFTDVKSDKWGPVVVSDGKIAEVNIGGCIEIASGNEACGRAYQQYFNCPLLACLPASQGGFGTCSTQDEFDDCRSDRASLYQGGPCEDALRAAQQACGADVGDYEEACQPPQGAQYVFEATIPAHCIKGGGNGGDGG